VGNCDGLVLRRVWFGDVIHSCEGRLLIGWRLALLPASAVNLLYTYTNFPSITDPKPYCGNALSHIISLCSCKGLSRHLCVSLEATILSSLNGAASASSHSEYRDNLRLLLYGVNTRLSDIAG
jgi:hypothetical protein